MLEIEILIVELGAVDRFPTRAITSSEITTLDHELLDDSVKNGALVRKNMTRFAGAFLTSAEGAEVVCCLGNYIVVQLESDASLGLIAN